MPPVSELTVVVNPGAGRDGSDIGDDISSLLPDATIVDGGDDLLATLREAAGSPLLGIAGGDGSINCAVEVAIERGRPLAVFPGGTLNHFARDAGLDDVDTVADAIVAGTLDHVDVGRIDGRPFLNTASFGAYAEMVDEREAMEDRLGKWLTMAIASWRVLRRSAPTELLMDGAPVSVWLIFIGNCEYDPPGFAPRARARLDDGRFDVRFLDAGVRLARTRTVVALLAGPLGRSRAYRRLVCERLVLRSLDGPLRLARDGETFDGGVEVLIHKDAAGLDVFRPR